MKKYWLIALTLLILIVILFLIFHIHNTNNSTNTNIIGNYKKITISDLNNKVAPGSYIVEGYVTYKSSCKCPKGAMCKCAAAQIYLSQKKIINDKWDNYEIHILTNPETFQLGKKYKIAITVDSDSYSSPNRETYIFSALEYEKIN